MRPRGQAVLLGAGLVLGGCAKPSTPNPPRVPLGAGYVDPSGAAPERLPMPVLPSRLEPARAGLGDLEPLVQALGEHGAVRLDADAHAQGAALDAALAHWLEERGLHVEEGPSVSLEEVVRTPVPARLVEDGASRRFDTAAIEVLAPEGGVRVVLTQAQVEASILRALPVRVEGGCEDTLAAMGEGQEATLALLEQFLDEVELRLARRWASVAPERIAEAIGGLPPASDACGKAGRAYLGAVSDCAGQEQRCALRPRIYLQGGLSIGVAEPSVPWTEACAGSCDVDPRAVLHELAVDVVGAELASIDAAWSERAERLAALGELQDAVEDVCAPRRHRVPARLQARAAAELERAATAYRGPSRGELGTWQLGGESTHVAGLGPVLPVATFDSGRASAAGQIRAVAAGLRPLVLDGATCHGRPDEVPWVVLLLEGTTVRYFGLFRGEELACASDHEKAGPSRSG